MPFGPLTPGVYLRGVDDYLAAAAPEKRGPFLEAQIRIVDSQERALSKWAAKGGHGNPPGPFDAFELTDLLLELGKRLANERETARQTIAAE